MSKIECKYSKGAVNRAGKILLDRTSTEHDKAKEVLDNWRACHIAPLNSFQTSLRRKLGALDQGALVSQRLKRTPSILSKLKREPKMKMARMQDIGGIRAVVKDMQKVREIESAYKKGTKTFTIVKGGREYINYPKKSGYRSVHLIFKYKNEFSIEFQIRTQVQHAWATAIETMGTFLKCSLKSGEGPDEWLKFFALTISAFAILESTPRISPYDRLTDQETFEKLLKIEEELGVIAKLKEYLVVARKIKDDNKKATISLLL